MKTSWPGGPLRIPRTRVRVVWGTGETMEIFPPHSALRSVDLPAEGRPTIATMPAFMASGGGGSLDQRELVSEVAEDLHQHGVELLARLRDDLFTGPFVAPGRLVGPLTGERVVDVRDGRDAGGERDVRARTAVGIAGAVVALVVTQGDHC